jgi:hypothetical protein
LIGAGIGLLVCVYRGAEALLWWIPGSWGWTNEDGSFEPLRSLAAGLFTLAGGLPLLGVFLAATEDSINRRMLEEQLAEMVRLIRASKPAIQRMKSEYEAKYAAAAGLVTSDSTPASGALDAHRAQMYRALIEHASELERVRAGE